MNKVIALAACAMFVLVGCVNEDAERERQRAAAALTKIVCVGPTGAVLYEGVAVGRVHWYSQDYGMFIKFTSAETRSEVRVTGLCRIGE